MCEYDVSVCTTRMTNAMPCINGRLSNIVFEWQTNDIAFRESEEGCLHGIFIRKWLNRTQTFNVQSVFMEDIFCRRCVCSTTHSKREPDENKMCQFAGK